MAFGQPSGPLAPARQVDELLGLLRDAGHKDFRDARGPMGFTQRQAAGKFTRDEVTVFINRLQESADGGAPPVPSSLPPRSTVRSVSASLPRLSAVEGALRRMPVEPIVAELRSRGWTVTEP